ncbi:uncharacterized protein TRIVIDRAFT_64111 [Trichoderma virens Gv29-8]|uniref:Uncharacterized protein n=1 Tax=Hypocrea virens (strain Gv29-8 / FGSC 10586) TaxID=413071 RepID=G9MNJ1_HYPVG|nr:uncharacterized protein TRIVIDRAFT_64111 [Trichoderma virens Gv29-8]EHK23447.1 hypothetical protein TRIVIDRAFT_64111 [Trichoderma virens Gv29-8]
MPEQRPTASDSFDPMGFEKRCRESVSSGRRRDWNERPEGVTCFVERERRREGETTDLGGRSTGRTGGGWAEAARDPGRCTPSGTGLGYEEVQHRRGTGATNNGLIQRCIQ